MFFSDLWPKTSQYRGFPNQGIFGCHVTIESWKVAPFGFMLSRLYVEMRFRERARRTFFQCLLSWLGPHGRHIGLRVRKLLQLSWLDVGAQVLWRPFATSLLCFWFPHFWAIRRMPSPFPQLFWCHNWLGSLPQILRLLLILIPFWHLQRCESLISSKFSTLLTTF